MRRLFVAVALIAIEATACGGGEEPDREVGIPDWWDTRTYPDVPARDTVEGDTSPPDTRTPETPDATPLLPDGAPCADAGECAGSECLPAAAWPGGYCTTRFCESDDDCASEASMCATRNATRLCGVRCESDEACRDGYWCAPTHDRTERMCVPGSEPRPAAPDGEACASDGDCAGGTCMRGPNWPAGYCTTRNCWTDDDCARGDGDPVDNRCRAHQPTNYCQRSCVADTDCRSEDGYLCLRVGIGQGTCVSAETVPPTRELDFTDYPFTVTCGLVSTDGEVVVDFTVSEDTSAYMIVPIARDGARVQPTRIELPDGDVIGFEGANLFQLAPSWLFGSLNPLVVPATREFVEQLQPGAHRLVVATDSADLCWYLLEEREPGATIDLNVFAVGLPLLDGVPVAEDTYVQAMFDAAGEVFGQSGLAVGRYRFVTLTEEVPTRLHVPRSETDLVELVQYSAPAGPSLDDALAVNVFLVRGIAGSLADVLGVSLGLPGAAGTYGTSSSGVVVTTEYLRTDLGSEGPGTWYTGIVLAHEVGHYLGLFHTSEIAGTGFDPLPDTPECRTGFPDGCPDLENLMFPFAGRSHTALTDDQVWQLRVNPLTKP